jgi:ring-1,2-phenylacetyl-CoA epoxidase subunit PaaC
MSNDDALLKYVLRLGDSALILGQRLIEIVAHGPELEEELANANFSLDYLGQARMFYSYAGELEGKGRTEDEFAMLRGEREFENLLLVEQANGHFGDTIVRAVLFETFYLAQLGALANCRDSRLAEIAARALKEISYHQRYARQWLLRLGDGTEESHERVQDSLNNLWKFTGELFAEDEIDLAIRDRYEGPDQAKLKEGWRSDIAEIVAEATLDMPEDGWMASGGRQGQHSEQFGFLVAEMQSMQRTYPGMDW